MKLYPNLVIASVSVLSIISSATGELSAGKTTTIFQAATADEKPDIALSLYPGQVAYMNRKTQSISDIIGNGSVADYILFNDQVGYSPMHLLSYSRGKAGLMGDAEVGYFDRRSGAYIDIWTESLPGTTFSNTPDFDGDSNNQVYTSICAQDIKGSIDISKLDSGKFYIIYGSFKDAVTVTATMSGSGVQDQIIRHAEPHGPARIHWWITEFSFSDAGKYDTITYHYENADKDGSRAHFVGVILDASLPLNTLGFLMASQ